jgi:NAD(P)-dependent dehydrogenase (short-subunit alcohol dehydrogenase family)
MADKAMGRTDIEQSEQLSTRPGKQVEMRAKPKTEHEGQVGTGKLKDKVALITGGDSGIGRAVAVAFAKEGANVAIVFLEEERDAAQAKSLVEEHGVQCIAIEGDIGDENFCKAAIDKIVDDFGGLDVLVNNAGEQHPQQKPEDISAEQFERIQNQRIWHVLPNQSRAAAHGQRRGDC